MVAPKREHFNLFARYFKGSQSFLWGFSSQGLTFVETLGMIGRCPRDGHESLVTVVSKRRYGSPRHANSRTRIHARREPTSENRRRREFRNGALRQPR